MIRYSLICDRKHDFEIWFKNSADYDKQGLSSNAARFVGSATPRTSASSATKFARTSA